MKRAIAAVSVAVFLALLTAQTQPGAAAEQMTVTEGPTAVRLSNQFVEATLSAERLHLVGLRLAGAGKPNLLQRLVTIYHTGQWQEEDSSPAYRRWETKLERRPDGVVAIGETSDEFFIHRRTVHVWADAPYLEVRYQWQCKKTFRTATYYSIPEICFASELDQTIWEGANGQVENLIALKDGKASPAWEAARGQYVSARNDPG